MATSSSPQPQAVGERHPNPSYVDLFNNKQPTQPLTKTTLQAVEIIHGEPTVKFSMQELHQFTIEEGLHQSLILKFSFEQPDMQELRKSLPKHFGIQGPCLTGWLARRHILMRFGRYEDYVLAAGKSVNYLVVNGVTHQFRIFPWTINFNPKEETSRAFVWISLPNLPPMLFAKRSLLSIASAAGKPVAIDKATREKSRPSTARVKVELDLLDKIPNRVRVNYVDEQSGQISEFYQELVYDNLPLFCSCCKHQGHEEKKCRIFLGKINGNEQKDTSEEDSSVEKYHGDLRTILNEKKRAVGNSNNSNSDALVAGNFLKEQTKAKDKEEQHENIDTTKVQGDFDVQNNAAKSVLLGVKGGQQLIIENEDDIGDVVINKIGMKPMNLPTTLASYTSTGTGIAIENSENRGLALVPQTRENLKHQKIMNASGVCNNQQVAIDEVQTRESGLNVMFDAIENTGETPRVEVDASRVELRKNDTVEYEHAENSGQHFFQGENENITGSWTVVERKNAASNRICPSTGRSISPCRGKDAIGNFQLCVDPIAQNLCKSPTLPINISCHNIFDCLNETQQGRDRLPLVPLNGSDQEIPSNDIANDSEESIQQRQPQQALSMLSSVEKKPAVKEVSNEPSGQSQHDPDEDASSKKCWADQVEEDDSAASQERENDEFCPEMSTPETLVQRKLNPNATVFFPKKSKENAGEKEGTTIGKSSPSSTGQQQLASVGTNHKVITTSSNAQNNLTDKELLDALVSTSPNTSKQIQVVGTSTFSPNIIRGVDVFERGEEDAILDECFEYAAREGAISPRQHRSGKTKNKNKTHGRNYSWDDKVSNEFVPRQLPMRQVKQKVAIPTTSTKSTRSKKN